MNQTDTSKPRRVLIASSHPLFGQGLRNLLEEWQGAPVEVVGIVTNLTETLKAWGNLDPDLVVVDYDDETLNRNEFLTQFMGGEKKLRVVLLSLQSAQDAVVYDRRTMAASQMDEWLKEWTNGENLPPPPEQKSKLPPAFYRENRKHLLIAGGLTLLMTAILSFIFNHIRMLPLQASVQAKPIDSLFSLELYIIAFLFSLIIVFMVYSIIFFRRKASDKTDAVHITGNNKLEVLWTAAPLVTVLGLAYLGGISLADTLRVDPQALVINVIGQQWSWRFEYPEYGITTDTLYMPVNRQANLELSSTDVIHSFWVPQFRVKQDALPGGKEFVRNLRVTPTIIGDFPLLCSEMCGLRHAYMTATVKVVSEADFNNWVNGQLASVSNDPATLGKALSGQYGCLGCHSIDGSGSVGPTWKGLAGTKVTLEDGTVVTADDPYLKQSIVDPDAKVVNGYSNIMPTNFARQLNSNQIDAIIAFIKSLK